MKLLGNALRLLRRYWRSYLTINAVYFGLMAAAMVFVSFNRELQDSLLKAIVADLKDGTLSPVAKVYTEGHVAAAVAVTFLVNFLAGSLLFITLPSLVVPFSGLALGCVRAAMWGVMFAPSGDEWTSLRVVRGALIVGLVLLEGHGYTLAMLAAYAQGKSFLLPQTAGASTLAQGYWAGIKSSAAIYLLVALQLLAAAVYEAVLAIIILPHLK